jgi:hypothetical protein
MTTPDESMTLNLGNLRRNVGSQLTDGAFDDAGSVPGGDWREKVPDEIRTVWKELSMSERLGVLLMAQLA